MNGRNGRDVERLSGGLTSFRRHIRTKGVAFGTLEPGTNIKETIKTMSAGAASPHRMRVAVEIFSLVT